MKERRGYLDGNPHSLSSIAERYVGDVDDFLASEIAMKAIVVASVPEQTIQEEVACLECVRRVIRASRIRPATILFDRTKAKTGGPYVQLKTWAQPAVCRA